MVGLEKWPFCIESQLKQSNAGDIVLIGHGAGVKIVNKTYTILPDEERYEVISRLQQNSENPGGEWNTCDITCDGNNIDVLVNGIIQNMASESTLSSGPIALQSGIIKAKQAK